MKHKIEFNQKCESCGGSGLYSGMGESETCAVVCHTCKGKGHHHRVITYEDFTRRKPSPKIRWVYQTNPGIKVGEGGGYQFKDFGGMSKEDWLKGKKFVRGMENRLCTCPAWWYQNANYKLKPEWKECIGMGSFSGCQMFKTKERCWAKFDEERGRKE